MNHSIVKMNFLRKIKNFYQRFKYPLPLAVKVGNIKHEIYPAMSKNKIKNIAKIICEDILSKYK